MIVTQLALPLIPLIGWGLAGLAGVLIAKKAFSNKEVAPLKADVKEAKKIAILGLQSAGKTTFLKFLQGDKNYKNYNHNTGLVRYEEFDMKVNNKIISIAKNVDIGGSETFMKNYEKILEGTDMAFFLFDAS